MPRLIRISVISYIISLTVFGSLIAFMIPRISVAESAPAPLLLRESYKTGKYLVVHLDTMKLELKDGDTVLAEFPIISQGKPGSYYETMGGEYESDYKTPLHFSSIGHVYMPWSVHVFGNYFIHGIPYYPDGTKVSSEYSGGCIRLSDQDAKKIYDFVEKGMPIIITRGNEESFVKTETATTTLLSSRMTNLMVATISLETLTQDNAVIDEHGNVTTRKKMIADLLQKHDTSVSNSFAKSVGTESFVSLMNEKARIIGLTSTTFTDPSSPVWTTNEDYDRFMNYILTYKSYLETIENTTSPAPLADR